MIFGYLILFISVIISAIAAYYSVVGLTAIFAAAVVPVMIMGGALEAGKIVATVWLHNNWRRAGYAFKMYLVPAIVFLMLLTSLGIFGFLSKAHGDQSLVSGDAMARVAIYDEKIKISKDNIDANRKALKQMDEAVDQVMGRSSDEKGADKAVAVRRSQQKERARLQAEIQAEQKTITALGEEAAPLRAEFRKVEAEVGPVKYIAALIYGDEASQNMLEAAVRWVIILIVVVFDPLALCLILAANKQLEWARHGEGGWVHDEEEKPVGEKVKISSTPADPAPPEPVPDRAEGFGLFEVEQPVHVEVTPEEIAQDPEIKAWPDAVRLHAQALDHEAEQQKIEQANDLLAEVSESNAELDTIAADAEHIAALEAQHQETLAALDTMIENYDEIVEQKDQLVIERDALNAKLMEMAEAVVDELHAKDTAEARVEQLEEELLNLNRMIRDLEIALAPEPEVTEVKMEQIPEVHSDPEPQEEILTLGVDDVERPGDYINPPVADIVRTKPVDTYTGPNLGVQYTYDQARNQNDQSRLAEDDTEESGNVGFGQRFPENALKGDMFLRVDMLPNRAYKYNGTKWIEVDKDRTDAFAYDSAYIEHLLNKLDSGEYDPDLLNDVERAQIEHYRNNRA